MMKIRTKLLLYFTVIVLLAIVIFYAQNVTNKRVFELYDESLDQFLQLSEISQKTAETYDSLSIYVLEPSEANRDDLDTFSQDLHNLQEEIVAYEGDVALLRYYRNMITSFLEEADQTVEGVKANDLQVYSTHLNEAEVISQYIHDTTLELIDNNLNSYTEVLALADSKMEYTERAGTTFFVSILLFSVLVALWFSNETTGTIRRLTDSAEEISSGHFTGEDVKVNAKDELWFLTKTFNQMKQNINESVQEIEEKARLTEILKETELRSLQNQINPHFLFNTLNTISKTAYIEDAERTSELITSVSNLLRYNLGDLNKPTVLKDEVEIVKEYFFIQSTRFGDRVEFHEDIAPDCLDISIPSLTLQPLVENAFMHGIEEMTEGARIELVIYRKDPFVMIEIRDNGIGMDRATVQGLLSVDEEAINVKKRSGHSTGIGLKNVVSRLKLFDKKSEVLIDSTRGVGTVITLKLSLQGGGKQ